MRVERRKLPHGFVIGVVIDVGAIEGSEDSLKGVVVALTDGVELVVVALGAVDGDGLEGVDGVCDHVVAVEMACDFPIGFCFRNFGVSDEVPGSGGDEAEGGDAVDGVWVEGITRDLFFDEAGVGFVAIESADDVVAVGPRVHAGLVFVVAVGFAEVNDIEPVAGPAFAVARGSEECVYGLMIRGL